MRWISIAIAMLLVRFRRTVGVRFLLLPISVLELIVRIVLLLFLPVALAVWRCRRLLLSGSHRELAQRLSATRTLTRLQRTRQSKRDVNRRARKHMSKEGEGSSANGDKRDISLTFFGSSQVQISTTEIMLDDSSASWPFFFFECNSFTRRSVENRPVPPRPFEHAQPAVRSTARIYLIHSWDLSLGKRRTFS